MEKQIEEALVEAFNELQQIGNGYGWTVSIVTDKIFPVIQAHVPTLTRPK